MAARADFQCCGPGRLTALAGAAAWATVDTVRAILEAGLDPNDINEALGPGLWTMGVPPLVNCAYHSRDNPEAMKSAQLLLEHRADVNGMAKPQGLTFLLGSLAQLYSKIWGATRRAARRLSSDISAAFSMVFGPCSVEKLHETHGFSTSSRPFLR